MHLKLSITFDLPSTVIRWIANFLTSRSHAVSFDGKLPYWLPITQRIVQSSGCILFLCQISNWSQLLIYFANILMIQLSWSSRNIPALRMNSNMSTLNKLQLNLAKTKEIVFNRALFVGSLNLRFLIVLNVLLPSNYWVLC